jgi:gamma-glutamyl:cysteine ligase YbdK (ATP-grasp superfamily)
VPPDPIRQGRPVPWSKWRHGSAYTLGIEEEVMLLDPHDWTLAPRIDDVLAALPDGLRDHVSSETHSSAAELRTGVHTTVDGAAARSSSSSRSCSSRAARRASAAWPSSTASSASSPTSPRTSAAASRAPRRDVVA